MTVAPFDHPFLSGLLGDDEIAGHFSVERELDAMCRFEAALAEAQGEHGVIPEHAVPVIVAACRAFDPDMDALREGTRRDGVVVPEFVRQLRAAVVGDVAEFVHLGATSQDVIDTSLILRLIPIIDIFDTRLADLSVTLIRLIERHGGRRLMAKTRMQSALPIRVADRIRNWAEPVADHRRRLEALKPTLFRLQFAGAVGTLDDLGKVAPNIRRSLADRLGLRDPEGPWQVQRAALAELANWLSLVSATLGKLGTDIGLMAQNEFKTARLEGGGSSSAMAHKNNPIDAEVLVTLARFNATQVGGMHQALLHEQERSGAMWTLEWMILPQMVVTTGAALLTAGRLTGRIVDMGDNGVTGA